MPTSLTNSGYLVCEFAAGRLELRLKPAGRPILLHAHCHQKAFNAVESIESGCCGMSGGFDYEASRQRLTSRNWPCALSC
ncbi:MAG: hypothetical protein RJA44_1178 [Pseudomonadota bacterium]|jgi:Fe-S oxidoreductase